MVLSQHVFQVGVYFRTSACFIDETQLDQKNVTVTRQLTPC